MADFVVIDPITGRTFHVQGDKPPTDDDAAKIIRGMGQPTYGRGTNAPVIDVGQGAKTAAGAAAFGLDRAFRTMVTPRAGMAAGMGSLIDKPGDLRSAVGAAVPAMGEALFGNEEPDTPSSELHKHTGTPASPMADLMLDSTFDPVNVASGGDSVLVGAGKGVIQHAFALGEETQRLYHYVSAFMLPRMNAPKRSAEIMGYLREAKVDQAARQIGLTQWLASKGSKLISRAEIMGKMLASPEFRKSLKEHLGPIVLRPGTVAADYWDRQREAERAEVGAPQQEGAYDQFLRSLAVAAAAGGVVVPEMHGARPLGRISGADEIILDSHGLAGAGANEGPRGNVELPRTNYGD